MATDIFDLAVIGGGVNGCGIARDAAGRGLSVFLCEQGDLASGTSSRATKLIHGGLRYLEFFEFRLVREALREREVLLGIAPHIIWPLRFVLPYRPGVRAAWKLRLGLFLYDRLGGRKLLPPTRTLNLRRDRAGAALQPGFRIGFEYSDCWVEDSRLVVLNAMDARERGATIATRTRLITAERAADHWVLTLVSADGAERREIRARILINATGPWVGETLSGPLARTGHAPVRLVRGSHIVVPRLVDHDRCYILQNPDGRIVFVIPYETDFSLIGTTDEDHHDGLDKVAATPAEIDYLCGAVSAYFAKPVTPTDVRWSYAGVRPLFDDGASAAQEATRDYVTVLDDPPDQAPLLSIFGGKITTYRRLAEAVLEKLRPWLPEASSAEAGWTGRTALPGGDFAVDRFDALVAGLARDFPFLDRRTALRLARAYGTRTRAILGDAKSAADLGRDFGAGLTEAEIRHLIEQEWAVTAEDILWRRSKLGLHMTPAEKAAVAEYLSAKA